MKSVWWPGGGGDGWQLADSIIYFCLGKLLNWNTIINRHHELGYIATTTLFAHRLFRIDCFTPLHFNLHRIIRVILCFGTLQFRDMNNWMRIVRTRLAHDIHVHLMLNIIQLNISADAMTECLVFSQIIATIDAYYHKWHASWFALQSDNWSIWLVKRDFSKRGNDWK